jgi:hypothetical protein
MHCPGLTSQIIMKTVANFRPVVAGLIALAALFLRMDSLQRLPVESDEIVYLRGVQAYAAGFRSGDPSVLFRDETPENPPLMKYLFGAALAMQEAATGANSAAVGDAADAAALRTTRALSAVFSAVAVFVLALASPAAGALLALHSLHVRYASAAMLEALPFAASLICVLAYTRSRFVWNRWTVLSAIALGAAAASKYLYCIVAIAILCDHAIDIVTRRNRTTAGIARRWWTPVAWGALSLVVFLLLNPYLWPDPFGRLLASLQFHGANAGSAVNNTRYVAWQPLLWLTSNATLRTSMLPAIIEPLTAAAAIFGVPALWRRQRVHALWIALGVVFLLLYANKWPQYALVVLAPLCIAAAAFLEEALRVVRSFDARRRPRIVAVAAVFAVVLSGCAWLGHNWHQGDPAFRSIVQEATTRMRDDEVLLFVPANPYVEPAVAALHRPFGIGDPIVSWDWSSARRLSANQTAFDFHTANSWLSEVAQHRMGVWLITYQPVLGDPSDSVRALLQRKAHALAVGWQHDEERTYSLTYFRFDDPFTAITSTQEFDAARIEGSYGREVGIRSAGCAQMNPSSAGGLLEVACLWRVAAQSSAPWNTQVSLRLFDAHGKQVLQSDQMIARSGLPTVRFDGTIFASYFLPLPESLAPGRYSLRVFPYGADAEYSPAVNADIEAGK